MRRIISVAYGIFARKILFRIVLGEFLPHVGISDQRAVRFVHIIAVRRIVNLRDFTRCGIDDKRIPVTVAFHRARVVFGINVDIPCGVRPGGVHVYRKRCGIVADGYVVFVDCHHADGNDFRTEPGAEIAVGKRSCGIRRVVAVVGERYQRFALGKVRKRIRYVIRGG